jgi:DNA polymerase III delta prime subunit
MLKSTSQWIDEFKPKKLEDINTNNEYFVKIINSYIENTNDIPNLILIGENGSGKKTIANLIAEKYQEDKYYILYIDSNMNKNREVIQSTKKETANYDVLSFAQKKCIKKKIVIINNFEELDDDSQHTLRNIMEKYNKTTAFILLANIKNKIIEPIQSRILIFNIEKMTNEHIYNVLYNILKIKEKDINLKLSNPQLKEILDVISIFSKNDIKCAINYLQLFSYSPNPTLDNFFIMFNIPSFSKIKQMILATNNISTLEESYLILHELLLKGHSPIDILQIIINILTHYDIGLHNKEKYIEYITEIYVKMDTSPTELQLYNLLNKFNKIKK